MKKDVNKICPLRRLCMSGCGMCVIHAKFNELLDTIFKQAKRISQLEKEKAARDGNHEAVCIKNNL